MVLKNPLLGTALAGHETLETHAMLCFQRQIHVCLRLTNTVDRFQLAGAADLPFNLDATSDAGGLAT